MKNYVKNEKGSDLKAVSEAYSKKNKKEASDKRKPFRGCHRRTKGDFIENGDPLPGNYAKTHCRWDRKAEKRHRTLMKFRKKPIVIDAIQYTGQSLDELHKFVPAEKISFLLDGYGVVATEMSHTEFRYGDWLIKGVNGEYYPYSDDVFKKTYEFVSEE